MTNVDLNIVSGGEMNLELSKLLQEIEILLTADRQTTINNYNDKRAIDQFLFKYSVNEQIVASNIESNIYENCFVPNGYSIHVTTKFLNGRGNKDILYIDIEVRFKGIHKERLIYKIDSNE